MAHGMGGGGGFGGHNGGWGDAGWGTTATTLAAGATTATGDTGFDVVTMNSAGGTITVSAIEYLIGGVGTDVVTLSAAGNTLSVRGIETLTGGAGTDVVFLAGFGNTIAVSGVETLVGCGGADTITITSGTVTALVNGGDTLTLAAANGADQVVLQDAGYRPYGDSNGYAQIANFQAGTDKIVVSGALRARVDDNSDGTIASAARATGAINLSTDEVVQLTTTVASLTDTDYASVRTALGSLSNSSKGADALVLATDGTNTGAYLIVDSNGDGTVAANEIRLLGLYTSTTGITASDLVYG